VAIRSSLKWASAAMLFLLCQLQSHAQGGFLTFPLQDSNTPVFHGWYYYKAAQNQGVYHGAIDIKAAQGTQVMAAADGLAIASCQPPLTVTNPNSLQFGSFVLVHHENGYSTLYAHLDSVSLPLESQLPCDDTSRRSITSSSTDISYQGRVFKWKRVRRGEVIGTVGKTGTTYFHLHFEVSRDSEGSYASHAGTNNQRIDPYAIEDIAILYPPPAQNCGNTKRPNDYLWTQCPPVSSPIEPIIFTNIAADGTYQSGLRFTFGYEASLNRTVAVAFPFVPTRSDRLSRLEIGMAAVNQGGTVRVELRTDQNGLPGALLESWLTDMPQSGTLASPLVALNSVANPVLVLGQQYWLVATAASGAGTGQWYTVSNDPSRFLRSINGGPWSGVQSARGAMRLYGSVGTLLLTISTQACQTGTNCAAPQGTTFDFMGSGFTPNAVVRRFVKDTATGTQTELTPLLNTDSSGLLSWSFPSTCSTSVGTFEVFAVDVTTGKESNHVTEEITPGNCPPTLPPSCTLTASPLMISVGDSSTLTWTTTGNPTSASINNGLGAVNPAGGSQPVSPSTDTTYTMTVSNSAGQSTCVASVAVTPGVPSFQTTGSLNIPRAFHSATLLNDGRVLIAGGYTVDNFLPIADVEVYDPATGVFTVTGSLSVARWGHSAVLLDDGRVLMVGGNTSCCSPNYVAQTEIYDPATDQFTFGPSLPEGRGGAAASIVPLVKLPDGSVLVIGGFRPDICGIPTQTVFRIDAQATSITNLGSPLLAPHGGPTSVATLLQTGEILVTSAKGSCLTPDPGPPYAELYNPTTNTSRLTAGDILAQRLVFGAVFLNDGRYVLVGGTNTLGIFLPMEVYDPATETFTNTNDMTFLATDVVAVLLPDGRALFTGNTVSPFAALLDPSTLSFTEVFPGVPTRRFHTLTRLQDGRVLLAGGEVAGVTTNSAGLLIP